MKDCVHLVSGKAIAIDAIRNTNGQILRNTLSPVTFFCYSSFDEQIITSENPQHLPSQLLPEWPQKRIPRGHLVYFLLPDYASIPV